MILDKFKYISYEELYENKNVDYNRFAVSIFSKSLNEEEANIELNSIKFDLNKRKFLNSTFKFLNLLKMDNDEVFEVNVVGYNEKGEEKILLEKYSLSESNINSHLLKENHFKLIFPNTGLIFDLCFDFSFILFCSKDSCDFQKISKMLEKSNLYVL